MGDECDDPQEKCGVFGLYAPELEVSRMAFFALVALQHRGQESCGIATYDPKMGNVHIETGMGLVNQVFTESTLKPLKGNMTIGHTRYSTAGKSTITNAQPVIVQTLHGQIGIVQNGNLTKARMLRNKLLERGIGMFRDSDVEIITQMLAANPDEWRAERRNSAVTQSNDPLKHTPSSKSSKTSSSAPSEDLSSHALHFETEDTPSSSHASSSSSSSSSSFSFPIPTVHLPSSHPSPSESLLSVPSSSILATSPTSQFMQSSPTAARRINWEARLSNFMSLADGAYSICVMTPEALFGARDFLGMRPLCIGKLTINKSDNAIIPTAEGVPADTTITRYILASESCAIKTIGGEYVREVKPGEIVRIDEKGLTSFIGRAPSPSPALCVFEYVYFSRPDSKLEGQLIHRVRQRLGEQLALESPPPKGDDVCVIGVPDSSLPAALGYAQKAGVPYSEGLCKNRYIHRTFIQPSDQLRKLGISLKFNPLTENIRGRKIVMVDDSIVRGSTVRSMITLLRNAGAVEVHVRISSPPVRHPCYMGVDMSTYDQLVGHNRTEEQVREYIGADSLGYLTHDGMMKAVHQGLQDKEAEPVGGHCSACFTGAYPLDINDW
eukprot:TRINITY_DN6788_c0_g1_i2.p1 TRINITY_DN6788_c0_g1~~TRINITY_DN6788_c0_g1_i2.p1  ORF type:complete len:636 (-),score=176.85 TRINITY_DN6788_c0_g1_i2:19-1845(-)